MGINGAGRNIRSLFEPLPPAGIPSVSASLRCAMARQTFFGGRRHVELGDTERAERVDDRVHDRRERSDIAGFARPLDALRSNAAPKRPLVSSA